MADPGPRAQRRGKTRGGTKAKLLMVKVDQQQVKMTKIAVEITRP